MSGPNVTAGLMTKCKMRSLQGSGQVICILRCWCTLTLLLAGVSYASGFNIWQVSLRHHGHHCSGCPGRRMVVGVGRKWGGVGPLPTGPWAYWPLMCSMQGQAGVGRTTQHLIIISTDGGNRGTEGLATWAVPCQWTGEPGIRSGPSALI